LLLAPPVDSYFIFYLLFIHLLYFYLRSFNVIYLHIISILCHMFISCQNIKNMQWFVFMKFYYFILSFHYMSKNTKICVVYDLLFQQKYVSSFFLFIYLFV
jgi:hypothetical protein